MFDSLNCVDWKLLHRQKLILVEWLSGKPPEPSEIEMIWGIVHLLDALQDDACAIGLWHFPGSRGERGGAQ